VAWTAILFLVPPVLTYRGFILDKPKDRAEKKRYYVTADDRLIYAWIADHTSPSSVVIESDICSLMPVYAHRRNFCPDPHIVSVFGYGDAKTKRYEEIQSRLLSGEPPTPEDMKMLIDLDNAIYIVLWREDFDRVPRAVLDERPDWFELVYRNAGGRIYYVRGT
jgi:hypothetical protein